MFTAEYLLFCSRNRGVYANKTPLIGDWYLDDQTMTMKVLAGPDDIANLSESAFFVPDLDDLFELLNNQILLTGFTPEEVEIKILNKDGQWKLEIQFPDGVITYIGPLESLHRALLTALPYLASVANSNRHFDERVDEPP